MTWTYSGDPSDSDRDAVRFLIQDTDVANQLTYDEEIDYELVNGGSVLAAAVAVAETIAAKLSRTGSAVTLEANYGQIVIRLRRRLAQGATPFAGGGSVSDKEARALDDDRVQPVFKRIV